MKYIIALLLYCFSLLEGKETFKIEMEEAKAIGNTMRSELNEMFKQETLLTQDDLLPDSQKGKRFDSASAQKSPFALELEKALEKSTAEDIDEAEDFLQLSGQVLAHIDDQDVDFETVHEKREETCVESLSSVQRLKETKEVKILPAVQETRRICPMHTANFPAKFNTKKSIKELQEKITKHTGSNIEILRRDINGRNVVVTYKHKDPTINDTHPINRIHTHVQGCFGAKEETITLKPAEEIVTWHVEKPEELDYLQKEPKCHLMDQSYVDSDTRYQVWHCEAGANEKCQALRDAGGILSEKTCLKEDQDGNCLKYLKIFSFETKKPLEKEYFLEGEELFNLEDFETASEADGFFGWVLSKLGTVFKASMEASQDRKAKDPMQSEVFPGQILRCRKSCSTDNMIDCCGRHSDNFAEGKCNADEHMLLQKRLEKKCHYIGTEDFDFGLKKEKVYICYPDIISRVIQEGAHDQLNIPWGDAKEPNKEGVVLEQLLGLDFDRIDFSDFEVDIKKKVDAKLPDIQKKIKSTVDSLSPNSAKSQTENLLREDMKKCFD